MLRYLQLFLFVLLLGGAQATSAQNLVTITPLGSRTLAQMQASFSPIIQYGIDLYRVTYTTPDAFGQLDTASGLLVVPITTAPTRFPICVYQHGTVSGPTDVPSNLQGGWDLAGALGGMGYVCLAPDYLGLGTSRGFHPYVHAATEASAAIDMMRAVRSHAPTAGIELNSQVFITGYSQGGHASAALHREIEANLGAEFTVTAAAHLSGPYSISGVMRERILSNNAYFYPAYVPNTFLSFNYVYDIYDNLTAVFKPAYVSLIESFFNGQISLTTLNFQLLGALLSNTGNTVAKNMLQDSIVQILETQPADHPMIMALRDNDVYEWAPQAPTRLFYCRADDQVPFQNSVLADSVMRQLGALAFDSADLNPQANHTQCVEPAVIATILFFAQFQDVQVATQEPRATDSWAVYPNPVGETVWLQGVSGQVDLLLMDWSGRPLHRLANWDASQPIHLGSRLPAGFYLLQIQDQYGATALRKVVVE